MPKVHAPLRVGILGIDRFQHAATADTGAVAGESTMDFGDVPGRAGGSITGPDDGGAWCVCTIHDDDCAACSGHRFTRVALSLLSATR